MALPGFTADHGLYRSTGTYRQTGHNPATAGLAPAATGTLAPAADLPANFCAGKPDGNYAYDPDCTKFIQCHKQNAYLQNCPSCNISAQCPEGALYYEPSQDRCLFANQASCNN